jgi:hypothetical protein
MPRPYRILSLAGGGVRGIFQAAFLSSLEKQLRGEFSNRIDLVVGTSTGALVGLAVALKVPVIDIVNFYRKEAHKVFGRRIFSDHRKGPHYEQAALKTLLESVYQGKKLHDAAPTKVVVTSASLDRYQHRLFSNITALGDTDPEISAAGAALASAAAPTYFAPVTLADQEMSYVDGGVWANSPSLLAVLIAHSHLGVPLDAIRVLSIGTGSYPTGISPADYQQLRPMSGGSVRVVLELMWGCQASFSESYCELLIPKGNYIRADVFLQRDIALDDVESALSVLPALAEQAAHGLAGRIGQLFPLQSAEVGHQTPPSLVNDLIPAAGLTAFYPSRDYYSIHRKAASSIDRYVSTAQKSLMMVSISLTTGVTMDGVLETFRQKLEGEQSEFTIIVSLLNPFKQHLMRALAPTLSLEPHELAKSIKEALRRLVKLKASIPDHAQRRFSIRVHDTIPLGSAILIDHHELTGRIQIETKVYRAPFRQSFAFEVAPTGSSGFYSVLAKGYEDLAADGHEVTAAFLQRKVNTPRPPRKQPRRSVQVTGPSRSGGGSRIPPSEEAV